MADTVNWRNAVTFIEGFHVGKIVGYLVNMLQSGDSCFEDRSNASILLDEFVYTLLSFNLYLSALTVIGGLILAIPTEGRRLEKA